MKNKRAALLALLLGLSAGAGPVMAGPGPFPNKGPFPNSGTKPGPLHKPKPYCDPRVCDDFRHRPSYGHRQGWGTPYWGLGALAASDAFADCYTVRRRFHDRHGNTYLRRVRVCE